MAPEWEAKEPKESWADAHVLGFQCVLRGGLSKGPGGRTVSVTVIFMVKMHDGKYKKCKSEMQTSAFCMCFQMISPTAQHCLGVQKVLTQGSVHRWPFAMLPPPPRVRWHSWTCTFRDDSSGAFLDYRMRRSALDYQNETLALDHRMRRSALDYRMRRSALHHTMRYFHYNTKRFYLFFKFYLGTRSYYAAHKNL